MAFCETIEFTWIIGLNPIFLSPMRMIDSPLDHFGTIPFSHGALLPVLKDYRRPNDKIAEWLRQGVLLSVKRGLYVRGQTGRAPCLP